MELTRNLPQKTTSTVLRKALEEDNSQLAIRELSQTSIHKILNARELRQDMEFQLEQLRNSYRFYYKTKGVPGRIQHIATLKKLGNELKAQLEATPVVPTLFESRQKGEAELLRVLQLMILSLVEYHTTTEVMSKNMVIEVSMRIIFQFGGLTLEDVALCFHQVKNGSMGKVYNRVDAAVIMQWLHKYQEDVQAIGEERNARMHNQSKTGVWKSGHEYRIVEPQRLKQLL